MRKLLRSERRTGKNAHPADLPHRQHRQQRGPCLNPCPEDSKIASLLRSTQLGRQSGHRTGSQRGQTSAIEQGQHLARIDVGEQHHPMDQWQPSLSIAGRERSDFNAGDTASVPGRRADQRL
ncbi:hypothetical protein D3C72_2119890 [compost metagenome]